MHQFMLLNCNPHWKLQFISIFLLFFTKILFYSREQKPLHLENTCPEKVHSLYLFRLVSVEKLHQYEIKNYLGIHTI